MSKKETTKFIVQLIASIASAILTALGATSCMGYKTSNPRSSLKWSRIIITRNDTNDILSSIFLQNNLAISQITLTFVPDNNCRT